MKLGIMTGAIPDPEATIDGFIELARDVEHRGFASLWMANREVFGYCSSHLERVRSKK